MQRLIEALVSYASVATKLYIMILNFVGLSLLFLLSGTRIKWTEPKTNTLETQTSLPVKEVCECFYVFTSPAVIDQKYSELFTLMIKA